MGKKGKGRQGFASKSLKADHHREVARLRDETLKWTRRETAGFVAWSNSLQRQQRRLRGEYRPRFAMALRQNLNGILQERQALRTHEFRQRRRRNGFLPSDSGTNTVSGFDLEHENRVENGLVHPAGWLLRYDASNKANQNEEDTAIGSVCSLQTLALTVFARYIRDYRDAMGDEEFYGALSILPPESITELSILLSSGSETAATCNRTTTQQTNKRGRNFRTRTSTKIIDEIPISYMDDDMAMLLGQHQDVERLCFRSTTSSITGLGTLTESGLEALIPCTHTYLRDRRRRLQKNEETNDNGTNDNDDNKSSGSTESVLGCWEDVDEFDESYEEENILVGGSSGCNLRLRRLELLDLSCSGNNLDVDDSGNVTTSSILLRWFETCSGITHLSLAGSFQVHHEVGRTILLSLPEVLPSLEVLDITRCPWATESLLARMMNGYFQNITNNSKLQLDTNHQDSLKHRSRSMTSPQDLLPIVYYYRGRFEWLPETNDDVELDLWEHDDN